MRTEIGGGFLRRGFIQIEDGDGGAMLGKEPGRGLAQAALRCRARDDGEFSFEQSYTHCFFPLWSVDTGTFRLGARMASKCVVPQSQPRIWRIIAAVEIP